MKAHNVPDRVHLVGIGGAHMSGIAQILHTWGHAVSGSDQKTSPVVSLGLVVPSGRESVRANDTMNAFRPGSDIVWLTGEHDPEAVLVMRPAPGGHDATLYVRPRSPRL